MIAVARRHHPSFGNAMGDVGLPRATLAIFGAVPLGIGVAVIVRSESTLPFGLFCAFVAISVFSVFGDELFPQIPELLLGLIGLAALVPVIVSGGDRLALVIAWFIVLRGTGIGSVAEGTVLLIGACGLVVAAGATSPGLPAEFFALLGMCLAWLAGMAARQILNVVAQIRATDDIRAEEAAREERRKLAREVHDVIAHSMTVTLLHVNGARLIVREDPEAAERALQRAERVGRASLEDLRRTVRLLSDTSDGSLGTSIDLRDDIERLLENFDGEMPVSFDINGDVESVPPYVALSVYRIVQESVTNAVRHSPGGSVGVLLDVDDERVSFRIDNSMGSQVVIGNGSGRGLHGMTERTALLGGHLAAGPTKDGWLVTGWVPRDVTAGGIEVG